MIEYTLKAVVSLLEDNFLWSGGTSVFSSTSLKASSLSPNDSQLIHGYCSFGDDETNASTLVGVILIVGPNTLDVPSPRGTQLADQATPSTHNIHIVRDIDLPRDRHVGQHRPLPIPSLDQRQSARRLSRDENQPVPSPQALHTENNTARAASSKDAEPARADMIPSPLTRPDAQKPLPTVLRQPERRPRVDVEVIQGPDEHALEVRQGLLCVPWQLER